MKKSLIAMALMFGAVVFVASCGGGGGDDDKTYNCTCSNTAFPAKNNLSEAEKNIYETACAASVVATGVAKEAPKATCQ